MALEHALLVSLNERAGTGYELTRRFDRSIGLFWSATHQQIYRVLHRMTELGWVSCRRIPQQRRPDKKIYAVTDSGRAEVARWIAEPADPALLRHELAIKVRGVAEGDLPTLLAEVARHRALHAGRLELYRRIEQRDFPDPAQLAGAGLRQYLVLRGGIRVESGFTEWCDEVLQTLRPAVAGGGPP